MRNGRMTILVAVLVLGNAFAGIKTIRAPEMAPPKIDGKVDPAEWRQADADSQFTQIEPAKGWPATETTIIRIGMDAHRLFVAFSCFAGRWNDISAGNMQRDKNLPVSSMKADDGVLVILDSFGDRRSAYAFHVNLLNTQSDARIESDGASLDANWDAEWQSATARTPYGWSAEFSISIKSLKFASSAKEWGVNFARVVARNQEIDYWSGEMDDNFRVSQGGLLDLGVSPKPQKPRLLIPYFSERYEDVLKSEKVRTWKTDFGLDAEIPITSDVSASVTVNPDFASVEGDREQINLDLWEIKYPEKRPFFRDLGALFDTRIQVFYSRRIGDILHGEKFAGKVKDVQIAGFFTRTNAVSREGQTLFPEANFFVFKLQKDILSASTLGMTVVEKQWGGNSHRVLSLDTKMRLPHQFNFTGQIVASAPGRFWDHAGGYVRLARENNIYHYHVRFTSYGRRFMENINPVGFLEYDNVKELDGDVSYSFWMKESPFRLIVLEANNRVDWYQNNVLWRNRFIQTAGVFLRNRFSLDGSVRNEYRLRNGEDTHYRSRTVNAGYNLLEWSHAKAGLEWGESFTNPFLLFSFSSRFKPFKNISLDYGWSHLRFHPDPAGESTQIHVLGSEFYATPDLFLRVFTQYRSNIRRFYFYGLFGYRYRPPNSAVYLTTMYDEQESGSGMVVQPTNRIVFLKISHGLEF